MLVESGSQGEHKSRKVRKTVSIMFKLQGYYARPTKQTHTHTDTHTHTHRDHHRPPHFVPFLTRHPRKSPKTNPQPKHVRPPKWKGLRPRRPSALGFHNHSFNLLKHYHSWPTMTNHAPSSFLLGATKYRNTAKFRIIAVF